MSAWLNVKSRFDAMTLRERALIAIACLAVVVLLWDQAFMSPLQAREQQLSAEMQEIQKSLELLSTTIQGSAQDNPLTAAMNQKRSLEESLAAVDEQLQSVSAGLIAPQRMLEALSDVLDRQRGLKLISMRNLPVTTLVPPSGESEPAHGPYVHALEFVVEGSYLDVLQYLQQVEALPWRFYWQVLELKAAEYPRNRVRIRLNTLSMDREWLGV